MEKIDMKPGNMLFPVPVVMVSSKREGEKPNIATVAWTGTVCSEPPVLYISLRPERYSYGIIKETGEFVVNLVNKELVRATDYCGVKSGRDIDKFKEMNLTPKPSKVVKCPGITESPVNLECKVMELKPLGSHDMFIAEIVNVSVGKQYMDEKGKLHLDEAGLTAYSHGEYFGLGEYEGKFGFSVKK